MSNDQQIDKLKGYALIFSHEFRDLIESFEMLVPVAENRELLRKLSESKRKPGIGIVRWSLVQTCIIGITKLAYAPSQPLRDKLKAAFSIPIKAAPVLGDTPTEEDLEFWKEIEKIELKELQQDFDRYLPQLEEQWQWFSQHEEAFKDLRDKRFAHIDVSLIDQEYKLREVEPPPWQTMKEAVERLIQVADILLTILHQKDEGFKQDVAIARKAAADFWET